MERYYVVIALTFIGFVALAAILLVPVYLFLKREEDVAKHWTDETIAQLPDDKPDDKPDDQPGQSRDNLPDEPDHEPDPVDAEASRSGRH